VYKATYPRQDILECDFEQHTAGSQKRKGSVTGTDHHIYYSDKPVLMDSHCYSGIPLCNETKLD
jgi:hypothetical protein